MLVFNVFCNSTNFENTLSTLYCEIGDNHLGGGGGGVINNSVLSKK